MKNNPVKAIIIDDDVFIHHQLKEKLKLFFPEMRVTDTCENAIHGIEAIKKQQPDLIFLDIHMPDLNGFEMLNKIKDQPFKIIFITSYNQYAIEAIRYSAFDYLLKPITDKELVDAIERFHQVNESMTFNGRMENLMHNMQVKNDFSLIIPTRQGEKQLKVKTIIRCEGDSNYTHFHLSDHSKFTASKTLKEFEAILSENEFVRIHKSHIINKKYIDFVSPEGFAVLRDQSRIEISRRRLPQVKSILASAQGTASRL